MSSLGSRYQLDTWRQGAPARGTYTQLVILGAILPSALIGHFGSKWVNLVLVPGGRGVVLAGAGA